MKFHVLGCGPAGLLAAHAGVTAGLEVQVHSIKMPSDIKGAQFIHQPVEGLTYPEPDFMVLFEKWGHKEVYAEKVYGDPDAPCSWDLFSGEVPAWSMIEVYQNLWEKYQGLVMDCEIRAPYIKDLLETGDIVVSSITPQGYCTKEDHLFQWQNVWINEECNVPNTTKERNVIVYNGAQDEDWYRSSMLGGFGSTEWGQKPQEVQRTSRKPLSTNCDCFLAYPDFWRIGRFGEFKKGLLVSDAYDRACEVVNAL